MVTAAATVVSNSVSGNGIISLIADPFAVNEIHVGNTVGYCDSIVALPISMNNMEEIVGLQIEANLNDALEFVDFTLSDRKADHSLYAMPINDSTYRILVLSMQNVAVEGHEGIVLNVTLHPVGTPSEEEYAVSVTDVVLSGVEGANNFTGIDATATFTLSVTQEAQLAQGWNWWSTYIEMDGVDGLTMLENQLGSNGLEIKSQTNTTINYYPFVGYDYWYGSLDEIQNEKGYKINMSGAANVNLTGRRANVGNHPITILPSWNWIGYPVANQQSVSSALSDFQPAANDLIKGQGMSSIYYEGYGWFPEVVLQPNRSYMYQSLSTESKTMVFANGRSNVETKEAHPFWENDIHAYADNFSAIVVVSIDGVEQRDDALEIGAFVNGENRGSVSLAYFEPLNRYFGVMTIAGQDGETVDFQVVNPQNGFVVENCSTRLVFESDAVVGNLDAPLTLLFATKENGQENRMQLYPNPVECNQMFTITLPKGEEASEWRLINALGVIVGQGKADAMVKSPDSMGVYLVAVICKSGSVYYSRIIVE